MILQLNSSPAFNMLDLPSNIDTISGIDSGCGDCVQFWSCITG